MNGVFGDPGVDIDLKFESRAVLFDIGDISRLPTRKVLRISDVFVSHTHMDHFAGFELLVRVRIRGAHAPERLEEPPGRARVAHRVLRSRRRCAFRSHNVMSTLPYGRLSFALSHCDAAWRGRTLLTGRSGYTIAKTIQKG